MARYFHVASGAEVLSVQADDPNKVFCITFGTPVTDSTGCPHILEHSVLCGSAKYRVKDPFTAMAKGSLQTYLNAFTFPDRTSYPVASQNAQDFYNLVDVYLDAVLKPRARHDPRVLAQEGWHYELPSVNAPLEYSGIVYNEMKGVYSTPDSLLDLATTQSAFPDVETYVHDSGGNPAAIPNLSFQQFAAYYDAHYHPANAKIYFYGDDPEGLRLEV